MKKKSLLAIAGIIACAGMLNAGSLLSNGSFEEASPDTANAWNTKKAGFWKGKGAAKISEEEKKSGKRSFCMTGTTQDAKGQLQSPEIMLLPDRRYRVTYSIKRTMPSVKGHINIRYESTSDKKLNEWITIMPAPDPDNGIISGQWIDVKDKNCIITFFEPKLNLRQRKYTTITGDTLIFPEKIFGKAPIKCRVQLQTTGQGAVYFDDIEIKDLDSGKAPASKHLSGIAEAEAQEQKRLMTSVKKRSKEEEKKLTKSTNKKYKLELPKRPHSYEVEKSSEKFPESVYNVSSKNGNIERDSKPVFLLGAETLSPWMCKLFGIDFKVFHSKGNGFSVKEEGDTIKVTNIPLPFLEAKIKMHLREGILVWLDMLEGYKVWQSKLLKENFPELFITKEAFFSWRPENPDAQRIRYSMYWNELKHAMKYPLFAVELFNEVAYEDFSSHNFAVFREQMREKYESIEKANKAWNTNYESFSNVDFNESYFEQKNISLQLRSDWHEFTEQRFGKILKECYLWAKKIVPKSLICVQSYCGFKFDFQENHTNPYQKIKAEDIYCGEHGGAFFVQDKGYENETQIMYGMQSELYMDILRSASPGKPIIDGECSFGPGKKDISPGEELAPLLGKWKFKPASICKGDPKKLFTGHNAKINEEDQGLKENWQKYDLDDSDWKTINVPGLWGNQGYNRCYIGWYRKDFYLSKPLEGPVYLTGSSLAACADVYVNGKKIHATKKWNETFSIDIAPLLNFGKKKNVIAARLSDNYFQNGFFWGGIRKYIGISKSKPGWTPISPDHLAAFMWQRVLHGYSGLCLSYFYYNEYFDNTGALLNPQRWSPEAIAALPKVKCRINSLSKLLMDRPRIKANVALTYSLDSFRAYQRKVFEPRGPRSFDYWRVYSGLMFSHREFDIVSDQELKDISFKKHKAAVVAFKERALPETLKKLENYVRSGGTLIVDGMSLAINARDGSKLDASSLLGAKRLASIKDEDEATFEMIPGKSFKLEKLIAEEGITAWPLELTDAKAIARDSKGRVMAAQRKLGKGTVYTIGASLNLLANKAVLSAILSKAGIPPALDIAGDAPYIEAHRISRYGKELWCLVNWGGKSKVNIKPVLKPEFDRCRIRDAHTGKNIPGPLKGGIWDKASLAKGIAMDIKNYTPCILLIEPEKATPLKLGTISDNHKEALKKFWLPIWDEKANPAPNGRALWLAQHAISPAMVPSAVAVIREMGLGIDVLKDKKISKNVQVLRQRKVIENKLADYKLVVINRPRANLSPKDAEVLAEYVKNGGSLFILGGHKYHWHSYNFRMKELFKSFNINIYDTGIEDIKNSWNGEPRQFETKNIARRPATEGVKTFISSGCAPLKSKAKDWQILMTAETSATSPSGAIMLMARIYGKGKVVVIGDCEWLWPEILEKGDNAKLFSNLVAWLTNVKPLTNKEAERTVKLEKF